jgi:hypothetical protein
MTPNRHYWDLEGTVIDNWDSQQLCNVHEVRRYVAANNITDVTIFSFAIWDEKDVATFHRELEPMLVDAFGVKFVNVLSAEYVRKVVLKHMRAHFDLNDFLCLWGKNRGFIEYCEAGLTGGTVTLLDDQVPNVTHINHDRELTMKLVNVNTLK